MTNKELISLLAKENNLTQAQSSELLSQVVSSIVDALDSGTAVNFTNLGTFDVRLRAERITVNPRTGKRQLVPPKLSVGFKASKNCLKLSENESAED